MNDSLLAHTPEKHPKAKVNILCLLVLSLLLHICHLDGRLLFVTPMDPLFLILYYLIKADKEVSLVYFFHWNSKEKT